MRIDHQRDVAYMIVDRHRPGPSVRVAFDQGVGRIGHIPPFLTAPYTNEGESGWTLLVVPEAAPCDDAGASRAVQNPSGPDWGRVRHGCVVESVDLAIPLHALDRRLRPDTCTVGPGKLEQHTVEVGTQHLVSGVARGKFFDACTGTAPPDRVALAPYEPLAVHDAGGSDAIEDLPRARWQGLG